MKGMLVLYMCLSLRYTHIRGTVSSEIKAAQLVYHNFGFPQLNEDN